MPDLEIFIDESGDVGSNSDFYIVTLVLHDQSSSIGSQVTRFENELSYLGIPADSIIHAGPIVRREEAYKYMTLELLRLKERRGVALSRSEQIFFESKRRLNKVFLKTFRKISFQ